jgi:hypothetical protein
MSSQSVNATDYSGFIASITGSPSGLPLRDSSDYIRMLKNKRLYRFYDGTAVPPATVQRTSITDPQSNALRLSYQFGQITCDSCPRFPKGQLGS